MLQKFRKHESVNLKRLKPAANQNTLQDHQSEKTADAMKKAERNFSVDLPLVVHETTGWFRVRPTAGLQRNFVRPSSLLRRFSRSGGPVAYFGLLPALSGLNLRFRAFGIFVTRLLGTFHF